MLFVYFLGLMLFVAIIVYLATRGSKAIDTESEKMHAHTEKELVKE